MSHEPLVDHPSHETITPPRRQRRVRFSLQTLFALVVMLAIPLAWIAKERRQSAYEQQVAEQLRSMGFADVVLGGPYDNWELYNERQRQGWWRELASQILGARVFSVGPSTEPAFGESLAAPLKNWDDLSILRGLTNINALDLNVAAVRDITPLANLTTLHYLNLSYTRVDDLQPLHGLTKLQVLYLHDLRIDDLAPLAQLTDLHELGLNRTDVRDLSPLIRLGKLTRVDARSSPVSKESVDRLQSALPNCKIWDNPLPQ